APRGDDATDGAEVRAVRALLVEPADDVGRDADERAERRRRAYAVLAAVPRGGAYLRHLPEVVHEELLRFLAEVLGAASGAERIAGKQFLQFLRERRLRDLPAPHAEQLYLLAERRVVAIVERAHHVVRRRQVVVAIELTTR